VADSGEIRDAVDSAAPVRLATLEDRAGVVATVVAAFAEDPAWGFLMGSDYQRLAPRFAAALFDLRAPAGSVWVAGEHNAVAMWDAPGAGSPPDRAREIWKDYSAAAGEQAQARLLAYNGAVAAAAPPESYWYLGVLATHPTRRRQGLASAVLAPALALAARDGLACCLETSTEPNRRFYEGRGFTEASDVVIAGGPPTWWLKRPAPREPSGE
jgi:ribosomal protein S18 acetylase RimI-like enzyme